MAEKTQKYKETYVKKPLFAKLIAITTIIIIFVAALITAISSYFFVKEAAAKAKENNLILVQVFSSRIQNELKIFYTSTLSFSDAIFLNSSKNILEQLEEKFFERNPSVLYFGLNETFEAYNKKFFLENNINTDAVKLFMQEHIMQKYNSIITEENIDGIQLFNASDYFQAPVLVAVYPYLKNDTKNNLFVIFSSESLQSIFQAQDSFMVYALSQTNELLLYPEFEILKTKNLGKEEIIERISNDSEMLSQFEYKESGTRYLIAFSKTNFGNFTAISQLPVKLAYEEITEIIIRNSIITLVILIASIFAVYFFAQNISRPILKLTKAAKQIEAGEFNIDLAPSTYDEIGLLTESFIKMGKGLAERERLRESFGKFVNKNIAEKAANGELHLGGERKTVTIFFSDIRSFTSISELMSPEAVVEFLNAYMTQMVSCIEETHGIVDKFIGDAIMGVWGAPVSAGSPQKDAHLAVMAMLLMRQRLIKFNKDRGTADKPILRIDCGVNTGECLAGQIGSSNRMEYTVIGDAVNTASRIESLNKYFKTDILLSESTYRLVADKVIAEPMQPIRVKGKAKPLRIYALINYKNAKGPKTLSEVRNILKLENF